MGKTHNIWSDSDYGIIEYDLLSDEELDFNNNGNELEDRVKSRVKSHKNATKHRRHAISDTKRLPNGWEAFDYKSAYDEDEYWVH